MDITPRKRRRQVTPTTETPGKSNLSKSLYRDRETVKKINQLKTNVPKDLQDSAQWVNWKYGTRDGKETKVPIQSRTNNNASTTNPEHWRKFDIAIHALSSGRWNVDGIGFVLSLDAKYIGLDVDDCLTNGKPNNEETRQLINDLTTRGLYVEISPSGNGLRAIGKGKKPVGKAKNTKLDWCGSFEMYDHGRYLTITGDRLSESEEIPHCQEIIDTLCKKYLPDLEAIDQKKNPQPNIVQSNSSDDQLINLAENSKDGGKFKQLFYEGDLSLNNNNHSEGDLALMSILAFWTNKDPVQMERIFTRSALADRKKWNGREIYRKSTIQKAIDGCRETYSPTVPQKNKAIENSDFDFGKFSLVGSLEEMEKQMLDDVFVLGKLALLGQYTVFYGKGGSGKTLLSIWLATQQISNEGLVGENLHYINADDSYNELVKKIRIAKQFGFKMIAPGLKDFKTDEFINYLQMMVQSKTARGKILILDTLKKFSDLMNKTQMSVFNQEVRLFTGAGGTVICLAHTNKNRSSDGKLIHAGTSDLYDDADCVYILDSPDVDGFEKTVIFECEKSRGANAKFATYRYSLKEDQQYGDLLSTVKQVGAEERKQTEEQLKIKSKLDKNAEIINAIILSISDGVDTKKELLERAIDETGSTRRLVENVIRMHTGGDYSKGARWFIKRTVKNTKKYELLAENT